VTLTIGGLARAAEVNVETVRFYHRRGLLPLPGRAHGSIRRYGETDLDRLRFIRRAQKLGFTLAEVALLLQLNDGESCRTASELGERKLAMVEVRLRDLAFLRRELRALLRRCRATRGDVQCPLIDALKQTDRTTRGTRTG